MKHWSGRYRFFKEQLLYLSPCLNQASPLDIRKKTQGNKYSKLKKETQTQQAKAIEPLNAFCFAIEKRNLSKYSSALTKKGEREKKTMLVYRGRFALLASFYLHFILKQAA